MGLGGRTEAPLMLKSEGNGGVGTPPGAWWGGWREGKGG